MKKIYIFTLFFLTIGSFAQTTWQTSDFQFYKKGSFRNPGTIKISLVKDTDTIDCKIAEGKIITPKKVGLYKVVAEIKKEKYVVDSIDIAKLNSKDTFIFGIETNIKNLKSSAKKPNYYTLPNSFAGIKIENLEQAKEVYFVIFTAEEKMENNCITVKSYSRSFLVKKQKP